EYRDSPKSPVYTIKNTFVLFFSGGLSTLPPHSREYHFVNQLMTWTKAQSYCREHFTDLVTIYNSNINQLLFSISPRINTWAWLGLYNDRYSWKWSMERKLFYVGSTHEFLIWANGQPDCAYAKEYCVALQGQTQLNDRPCGDSYPFLCYNECKVPPTAHLFSCSCSLVEIILDHSWTGH
uniref:C-type lectin domain-containing protein n=1 Tax=Oreochromis aureus TaxID=47969 RepID=A0A668RTJ8_OREAU